VNQTTASALGAKGTNLTGQRLLALISGHIIDTFRTIGGGLNAKHLSFEPQVWSSRRAIQFSITNAEALAPSDIPGGLAVSSIDRARWPDPCRCRRASVSRSST
jgi:hypothetical protein